MAINNNQQQHTLEWYRDRMGKITGSNAGLLMKLPRTKTETFTDTAKTYLYQVAAERDMNPLILEDDALFADYLEQVNVTTRAMQWGTDQEEAARQLYAQITGADVNECGSCPHPTIPLFASSPDGIFVDEDTAEIGCLEIKCPAQATFMRYRNEVTDAASLLSVKYEYYYQCMAHMMCTGAAFTDFVVYSPWQDDPLHIVRIKADNAVFAQMEERITTANNVIDDMLQKKKPQSLKPQPPQPQPQQQEQKEEEQKPQAKAQTQDKQNKQPQQTNAEQESPSASPTQEPS